MKRATEGSHQNSFEFRAEIWLYPGMAAWHFVSLPKKDSERINTLFENLKRGWGSLPVKITLGSSIWESSIFPDKKAGTYLLPIKAAIRKKEGLSSGDLVNILLKVRL